LPGILELWSVWSGRWDSGGSEGQGLSGMMRPGEKAGVNNIRTDLNIMCDYGIREHWGSELSQGARFGRIC